MKLFFLFFLFFLNPIFVLGSSELFNGNVCSNFYKSVDNTNFTVFVDMKNNQVLVNYPKAMMIIPFDRCESNKGITACVKNLRKGECNVSGVIKWVDLIDLTINLDTPNIIVAKNISGDILLNKSFVYTINFKNDGLVDADNFSIREAFQSSLFDIFSSTCPLNENEVHWNGVLKSRESKKCEIQLFPKKSQTYDSKTFVKYFNGIKIVQTTSRKSFIIHSHGITLLPMISSATPEIGSKVRYSVELNVGKLMKINSFKIEIPKGIIVSNFSKNLSLTNRSYLWSGTVDDSLRFDFDLKPVFFGNKIIKAIVNYEIDGLNPTIEKDLSLNVTGKKLEVQVYYKNITDGKASFNLVNLGDTKFENINCQYKMNNQTFSSHLDKLLPLTHKEVYVYLNYTTTVPIQLSYNTIYGQRLKENFSVSFIGKPVVNKAEKKGSSKVNKNETKSTNPVKEKDTNKEKKASKNYLLIIIATAALFVVGFFIIFLKKKIK